MENQILQSSSLPRYIMPLLVTSVFLSILAVAVSIFLLARSSCEVHYIDSTEEISEYIDENIVTYQSTGGNFIFSIPHDAVVKQTDAGGRSAISVYDSEDSLWQSEGLIYSILFMTSSEFETGNSYSFTEWLDRKEMTLTENYKIIGGLEFYEGRDDETGSLFDLHYIEEVDDERAYVISIPVIQADDVKGEYVQDSLKFNPTDEELDNAQLIK